MSNAHFGLRYTQNFCVISNTNTITIFLFKHEKQMRVHVINPLVLQFLPHFNKTYFTIYLCEIERFWIYLGQLPNIWLPPSTIQPTTMPYLPWYFQQWMVTPISHFLFISNAAKWMCYLIREYAIKEYIAELSHVMFCVLFCSIHWPSNIIHRTHFSIRSW